MIERILPAAVVVVEAIDEDLETTLFAEERAVLGQAVEKRRREFTSGRACAHRALEQLGLPPGAVASGPRGEPLWPTAVVGSITHCEGYRACALGHAADLQTIGIDAEPHAPLPQELLADVARPEELSQLGELSRTRPSVHWDRLLFSAKESVYKAWYPLAERWLGFEDATLTIDAERGAFSARLLVPGPLVDGAELDGFSGRWLVRGGHVLSAIAVGT